jgi:hypothetical protein
MRGVWVLIQIDSGGKGIPPPRDGGTGGLGDISCDGETPRIRRGSTIGERSRSPRSSIAVSRPLRWTRVDDPLRSGGGHRGSGGEFDGRRVFYVRGDVRVSRGAGTAHANGPLGRTGGGRPLAQSRGRPPRIRLWALWETVRHPGAAPSPQSLPSRAPPECGAPFPSVGGVAGSPGGAALADAPEGCGLTATVGPRSGAWATSAVFARGAPRRSAPRRPRRRPAPRSRGSASPPARSSPPRPAGPSIRCPRGR